MRLRSFRMGRGPIPCLACLTRLIPHCCLFVTHSPLSTFHCSLPFHYFFHGRYLVLCLGEIYCVICSLSPGSCGNPFDEPLSSESPLGLLRSFSATANTPELVPDDIDTAKVGLPGSYDKATERSPQEIQKNEYNTGGKEKGNTEIGGRRNDNAIGQSNGRVVGQ